MPEADPFISNLDEVCLNRELEGFNAHLGSPRDLAQ
jgi:hypothetical protein